MGIFARIKKAWYDSIIWETIDEDFYDELEESLIMADLGASVAADAVKELRKVVYEKSIQRGDDVKQALRDILEKKLEVGDTSLDLSTTPSVVLIIGVNGVGKTTSIGKLANRYKKQGKRVLLCAADTFRAAAADQLEIWADRAGVEIVRSREGADPGAVLFDSLQAAKARNVDVVFCDTAGRLHNKANLMQELAKLRKIIDRETPDAAKETLLVLDATTGQNAVHQAEEQTVGNEFGMEDSYYNTYIGRRLAQQAGKDASVSYDSSPEYDDLRCLFAICKAKQMQILFVHVPMHGAWSDYTGFSAERRQTYYENVRRIAAEYENVTLLDLTGYEYESYFLCDTMHLGWKGWLAVDKAIAEFWEAA